jgi:hypothetical protein
MLYVTVSSLTQDLFRRRPNIFLPRAISKYLFVRRTLQCGEHFVQNYLLLARHFHRNISQNVGRLEGFLGSQQREPRQHGRTADIWLCTPSD